MVSLVFGVVFDVVFGRKERFCVFAFSKDRCGVNVVVVVVRAVVVCCFGCKSFDKLNGGVVLFVVVFAVV